MSTVNASGCVRYRVLPQELIRTGRFALRSGSLASPQDLEKLIERIRCNAQVSRSTTSIVLSTLKETSKVMPN